MSYLGASCSKNSRFDWPKVLLSVSSPSLAHPFFLAYVKYQIAPVDSSGATLKVSLGDISSCLPVDDRETCGMVFGRTAALIMAMLAPLPLVPTRTRTLGSSTSFLAA